MAQSRKMPTELCIRKYWAANLVLLEKFDSIQEALEKGFCFACGFEGKTRCHIKARCTGGDESLGNLHILCDCCHVASEYLEGPSYWKWFITRNAFDRIMQECTYKGLNPSYFITLNNLRQNGTQNVNAA